jgi:hypothetical protein
VRRPSAARPKGLATEEIGARREGLGVARDIRPNAARLGVLNDCISYQTKLCCKEKKRVCLRSVFHLFPTLRPTRSALLINFPLSRRGVSVSPYGPEAEFSIPHSIASAL